MELGALRGCLSTLPHPKNLKKDRFGLDLCLSSDLCCCRAKVYASLGLEFRRISRVLARVLKIEIRVFPSVFECSRVLLLAINAHEII
jgi:hypothetical protein